MSRRRDDHKALVRSVFGCGLIGQGSGAVSSSLSIFCPPICQAQALQFEIEFTIVKSDHNPLFNPGKGYQCISSEQDNDLYLYEKVVIGTFPGITSRSMLPSRFQEGCPEPQRFSYRGPVNGFIR